MSREKPKSKSLRQLASPPPPASVPVLYLASANPGKWREFRQAAASCGIALELLPHLREWPPCVEDGETFEANARRKALHYSAWTDGWVLADDSGLCVEALGGAPGVHSARYAGPGASDAANNAKLMAELRHVPPPRRAHYACVLAVAERGRIRFVTEGRADGFILDAPRGSNGFGYDPYFFYPPLGQTFAELGAREKFEVSHRGIAFRKLLEKLTR